MALYFRIFYARESFNISETQEGTLELATCLDCFLTLAQYDMLPKEYSHVILQGRIKVIQLPGIKYCKSEVHNDKFEKRTKNNNDRLVSE